MLQHFLFYLSFVNLYCLVHLVGSHFALIFICILYCISILSAFYFFVSRNTFLAIKICWFKTFHSVGHKRMPHAYWQHSDQLNLFDVVYWFVSQLPLFVHFSCFKTCISTPLVHILLSSQTVNITVLWLCVTHVHIHHICFLLENLKENLTTSSLDNQKRPFYSIFISSVETLLVQ